MVIHWTPLSKLFHPMKQESLISTERRLVILFVGWAFIFLTIFEGFFLGTRLIFENQIQDDFFENMVSRNMNHDDMHRWAMEQGRPMMKASVWVNFIIIDGSGNLISANQSEPDEFSGLPELLGTDFLAELDTEETITYSGLLIHKVPDLRNPWNFKILIGKRGYPFEDLFRDIVRFLAMNIVIVFPFWFMARYFVRRTLEPVEANMNAMSHFVHDAGHELRTPLAIISGNLQILRDSKKPEKDLIEKSIATISSMSDSLGWLLELVSLGKWTKRETIPLLSKVEEIIETHKKDIELKNIKVDIAIAKNTKFSIHPHHFQLLFSNLLQNAIRYNKENGTIKIDFKNATLSITDTGIGMTESDTKKVFDRFFRVDRSGKYEWTGIGLSMVDRIIKLYEWNIKVESTLGVWTTFSIKTN